MAAHGRRLKSVMSNRSIRVYVKNTVPNFIPIRHDAALGFLKSVAPGRRRRKRRRRRNSDISTPLTPSTVNTLPPVGPHPQSRRKDPLTPRSGGPHACSGASCCVGEPTGTPKCEKYVGRRGSTPDPAGGAYSAPPKPLAGGEGLRGGFAAPSPRTPLTILSLCLSCVYVHTCMKMHCYFPLNVKHGASQLY